MLTTEQRQSLTGLMLHPSIYSVGVRDFRHPNGTLKSDVTIHTVEDANREEILSLLINTMGVLSMSKGNYKGQDGKRVFIYDLIMKGAHPGMSTIYFTETIGKEKAPLPEEAPKEILHPDCIINPSETEDPLFELAPFIHPGMSKVLHPDCIINVTKAQSLLEPWYVEQILEERGVRK